MKWKMVSWLCVSILIGSPVLSVAAEIGGDSPPSNKVHESDTYSTTDSHNTADESISNSDSNEDYVDNESKVISSNGDVSSTVASEKKAESVLEEQRTTNSSDTFDTLAIDSWMPDKNLQNEVSNKLGKPIEQITQEDMTNLKEVDFSSIEKDTVVDLTGLQYAINLQRLVTSKIIATNIPQITMTSGATLFTRPNVLQHIVSTGSFSNIHVGNYDAYLATDELLGVGQYLEGWNTNLLSIYTQNMFDFSSLDLPTALQENADISISTQEQVILDEVEIKNGDTGFLYTNPSVKDTQGNPLLSSISNVLYPYIMIYGSDKTGNLIYLNEDDDFQMTEKGIQFNNVPPETENLFISFMVPGRSKVSNINDSIGIQYGVNYQIPIKYVTQGEDVTVKYVDVDGRTIAPDITLSGNIGEPYSTEEVDIDGYTLKEVEGNIAGTFSDTAQEVVYVYERSDAAPVTVKYQDSEGNQLAEPTVLNGKVGLPYTSEAKEIPGWYVAQTPTNVSGTFSDTAQEVVYVYERSDAAPVTVKYQDSEGNQLAEPTVLNGKVGLPYTSEAKEIPGWYVAQSPTNVSGTFSDTAQEVVYVYERSDTAPVTVKYQDSEGNQLAEPTVLSGKVGLPYTSEAKEIPGWYVAQTPTNASGTFSDTAQEVVYVYERSDAAPVTVKYQDSEGNQLAEPTVLSGKVGLSYTSEAKEISGWYVVQTPTNASGTFSNTAQEVIYLYNVIDNSEEENVSDNSTPENNTDRETNNNFDDNEKGNSVETPLTKEKKVLKKLPNTGENTLNQIMMIISGLVLIIVSLVIMFKRKKINKS